MSSTPRLQAIVTCSPYVVEGEAEHPAVMRSRGARRPRAPSRRERRVIVAIPDERGRRTGKVRSRRLMPIPCDLHEERQTQGCPEQEPDREHGVPHGYRVSEGHYAPG